MQGTKEKWNPKEMSFLDHLDELRQVLIISIISVLGLAAVAWFFSARILDILLAGIPVDSLYFTSPTEAFMVRLKVSFAVGFLVALPIVLYKIWYFVSPGLFERERKVLYPLIVVSTSLFYAGVAFSYVVLIPIVMRFLLGFGTELLNPLISIGSYFMFVARLCLAFGIVFQLPLIIFLLSIAGIVDPKKLLRQWRWVVLSSFIVGAVLTPPDLVSQLMMALPMILLLLVGILVSMAAVKKRAAAGSDDEGP